MHRGEWVNGEIVDIEMPKYLHQAILLWLARLLAEILIGSISVKSGSTGQKCGCRGEGLLACLISSSLLRLTWAG